MEDILPEHKLIQRHIPIQYIKPDNTWRTFCLNKKNEQKRDKIGTHAHANVPKPLEAVFLNVSRNLQCLKVLIRMIGIFIYLCSQTGKIVKRI